MKPKFGLCLLLSLLVLAACQTNYPTATPIYIIVPPRTPVPTWTLPFSDSAFTPLPLYTTVAPATVDPSAAPPTATLPPSPTARPGIDPTLDPATPDPYLTPEIPIPEPMPQLHLDAQVINILLIGRDTIRAASTSYRTDVMIVASVDKKNKTVTMLTIPRDLFVYIPGWTMNRINTAATHGDATGYPGGGIALLEQTILYNLGIPIHGWARIDFDGFKNVVNILGGVDVPVTCAMSDWRLKSPELDQQKPENWEMYTVTQGIINMDGDFALWYARARKHSSDYDRSRRQHQVLRAMFTKALQLNMLPKIPEFYGQYVQIVDTDLGLGDILQFVPMAGSLDGTRIRSRFIGRDQVFGFTTAQGAQVLLPDREAITRVLEEAFQPPTTNMLARPATPVEIWNGTALSTWPTLAAENLMWSGFAPVFGQTDSTAHPTTLLYDFTTSPKGSPRAELQRLFNLTDAQVVAQPDPNAAYPFRIILGSDYNTCVKPVYVARPTPTPGPNLPTAENIVHAAPIVGSAPPVDGNLSEWTNLAYPISEPGLGRENWQGASDLSAVWNTAWDDRYLYLAVKVTDEAFVQTATGENLFRGDSLELWLDIDPGARTHALTERDYQLGLSAGALAVPPLGNEVYLWQPQNKAGGVGEVQFAVQAAPGGYQLEIAVPWSTFNLTPFAGEGLGFTLALNDADTPGGADQQTQLVSLKNAKLSDPLTWGILVLDMPPQ